MRETEPAVHVSVNDSFMSTGWFFRDEQTVSGSASGSVKHVVYSGERVQQDAALALVYADEQSLALSREIEPLEIGSDCWTARWKPWGTPRTLPMWIR